MACPFARRAEPVRQASVADANWNIEDDLADIPDDALALTHLQLAIQLLTAPSVSECLLRNFLYFCGKEIRCLMR